MQRAEAPLIPRRSLSNEAQRISSILKHCISQVEVAASLPAVLQLNAESNSVDEELSALLQKHHVLAEKVEAREGVEQEPHEERDQETEERERRVEAQLHKDTKDSVRDVLRFLRVRPDAISGLKLHLNQRAGESEALLIGGLKVFHSQVLERLQTGADEKPQPLPDEQRLASLTEELQQLVQQEEEADTAINLAEKSIEMEAVQDAQRGVGGPEAASALVEKQVQLLVQTYNQKQASLQQEIDGLNAELYHLMAGNRRAEKALQEKNEKVELEIEYLLQQFDNEIEETQANLECNEQIYEREQEEVRKLEEPFSVLEKEYKQILERRQLAEERRQEELRELELKTRAALYAQAWWRGYTTRKALKSKSKSKKAKKGKGRKTK